MSVRSVLPITSEGGDAIKLETCSVVPPKAVIKGKPVVQGTVISEPGDGKSIIGVQESAPYAEVVEDSPGAEFRQVLEGKVILTVDVGNASIFGEGDSGFVPKGVKGTFPVVETMRKYYALYVV